MVALRFEEVRQQPTHCRVLGWFGVSGADTGDLLSGSDGAADSRSSNMPCTEVTMLRSRAHSCGARADRNRGPSAVSTRLHLRTAPT